MNKFDSAIRCLNEKIESLRKFNREAYEGYGEMNHERIQSNDALISAYKLAIKYLEYCSENPEN